MSPASICYHFPTKEELLKAALTEISSRTSQSTVTADGEHPRKIRDAAQGAWEYHRTHAAETRLLYLLAATGPPFANSVLDEFVARQVALARLRTSRPEKQSRLDLAIEDLTARAYVRLAMTLSLAWASGSKIAGYRQKSPIVEGLIRVSECMTGTEPGETPAPRS